MYKIGFLGLGKMGSAILNGILSKNLYDKSDIAFYAPSLETQNKFKSIGLNLLFNENELFHNSEIIVHAVKPQKYDEVFSKINNKDYKNKIVISLAPGKSINYLKNIFVGAQVVRAMPNTPALINKGVTTLAFDEEEIEIVKNIFSSIGTYLVVEEQQIDEAIPLNGSMPAYIFEFAKAFIECGASYGMDYDEVRKLVLNSIIGSCELALSSSEPLDTLISNVCSKGGSTIEGLNELRNNNFSETIASCYKKCVNRSKELAKV